MEYPERRDAPEVLEWAEPAQPFVDNYLAALLGQAYLLVSSAFHEVVTQHGLSIAEWRVLATLAGGRVLSIGELARIAVSKQSTVTRMLDRMTRKGHVERLAHERDRRITLVRITPAGDATVAHLIALAQQHEQEALAPLGSTAGRELKRALRRLIETNTPRPRRLAAVAPASRHATMPPENQNNPLE